jgi:hypothetical protein
MAPSAARRGRRRGPALQLLACALLAAGLAVPAARGDDAPTTSPSGVCAPAALPAPRAALRACASARARLLRACPGRRAAAPRRGRGAAVRHARSHAVCDTPRAAAPRARSRRALRRRRRRHDAATRGCARHERVDACTRGAAGAGVRRQLHKVQRQVRVYVPPPAAGPPPRRRRETAGGDDRLLLPCVRSDPFLSADPSCAACSRIAPEEEGQVCSRPGCAAQPLRRAPVVFAPCPCPA